MKGRGKESSPRPPPNRKLPTFRSEATSMIRHESLLVMLVRLVDSLPLLPPPARRGRGRPRVYADRLFLKALVVMIVRHVFTVSGLLAVVVQPTAEMAQLRPLLCHDGRFPSRRTWERRLANL